MEATGSGSRFLAALHGKGFFFEKEVEEWSQKGLSANL
jgi:hypothetical protein